MTNENSMSQIALGAPADAFPTVDPNVAANLRFKADASPMKVNLAIGTNVGADGRPWSTATAYPAALAALVQSLGSSCGSYTVADPGALERAQQALCELLAIPADVRPRTVVSWPTGGGSGALTRGLSFIRAQRPDAYPSMVVQRDSWPGYSSVAYTQGIAMDLCAVDLSDLLAGLPTRGIVIAQTVHNGTGRLIEAARWTPIARLFAANDRPIVLDVPYLGFDFSRLPYDEAIRRSAAPIRDLVAAGTALVIAFGPTKIFNTFAYRPGGATLAICRSVEEADAARAVMKRIERGSSGFIDVATLALVHALADDAAGLRRDHAAILARLADAAADWRAHAAGTPLAQYFTDAYGGLFRIVAVQPGAIDRLAAQHIHTVDASTPTEARVRINTMGLPRARAGEIVAAVAAEVV
jgi:aspartate/tyrosine/aromatic aminotransferase